MKRAFKMKEFVISDLHLFHKNIINLCRPQFSDIAKMHETIITNWNKAVSKCDLVYVLGDVLFKEEGFQIVKQLNGSKILVAGNHDNESQTINYLCEFAQIRGAINYHCKITKKRVIMTHIPIHPLSLTRWDYNLHGHLHTGNIGALINTNIKDETITEMTIDKRYINVSCEQLNYTPILISRLIEERGFMYN